MLPELFRDLGLPAISRSQSRWTSVNGRRLHSRSSALVGNSSIPFVLVHGLVISSLYMIPLAERIAEEHAVHALDLPGFGRSEGPSKVLTIPELAEWVIAWMTAMDVQRCHLVANSLGCEVCAQIVVNAPERVATLTLIGPTIDPQAHAFGIQAVRLLRDSLREPFRLRMNWMFDFCRAGLRRAIGTTREMFRNYIEQQLPRIAAPTLVLRGENDSTVPQSAALAMTQLLRCGHLVVIAEAPHCVHYTNPSEVWEAIRGHAEKYQR
jgi:2-hydroxy-6-oxonona-2,4-dienedioate hydrolase